MKLVDPVTFAMPYTKFKEQFFVQDRYRVRLRSEQASIELATMVANRSLIITKEDCLMLPPTTHITHSIELSPAVMKQYDDMLRNCFIEIINDKANRNIRHDVNFVPSSLAKLMKLREIASGFFIRSDIENSVAVIHYEKQKELLRVLRGLGGDQAVIWCQYRYEIETLAQLLAKEASVTTAYGGTKDVDKSIEQFKECKARYILANPQTLKYGVTLNNCHYAVYYSMSYSHEDYYQSHDRIYRQGQTKPCTFIFIQAADTIDEVMYECVMNKKTQAELFEKIVKQAARHGIDYEKLKHINKK